MDFLTDRLNDVHIEQMCTTLVVDSEISLQQAVSKLRNETVLALDCEGIDLGRLGKVSIVQVSSRSANFIFDVMNEDKDGSLIMFLKSILENQEVCKIIHDCRMDSDALFHLYNITVCSCHDTQVWDKILFNREKGSNLNKTLSDNDCEINTSRQSSVYQKNNTFWATRPLTKRMIDWATGDVSSLFQLYDKQVSLATLEQKSQCKLESERSESFLRDCFIHKSTVKSMSRLTGSGILVYVSVLVPGTHCQPRGNDVLWVYGVSDEAIRSVLVILKSYLK